MIEEVRREDIPECVRVIRNSFKTVADEFGFTEENAPRLAAFATTEERLLFRFDEEHRPMYKYCDGEKIIGYYSLSLEEQACELHNLSLLPDRRHRGIGRELLLHAFETARKLGCNVLKIGIVEENTVLRAWYGKNGFKHTGTRKFDFFPFTCGYMEKEL